MRAIARPTLLIGINPARNWLDRRRVGPNGLVKQITSDGLSRQPRGAKCGSKLRPCGNMQRLPDHRRDDFAPETAARTSADQRNPLDRRASIAQSVMTIRDGKGDAVEHRATKMQRSGRKTQIRKCRSREWIVVRCTLAGKIGREYGN